jgi:hypothetical protein
MPQLELCRLDWNQVRARRVLIGMQWQSHRVHRENDNYLLALALERLSYAILHILHNGHYFLAALLPSLDLYRFTHVA